MVLSVEVNVNEIARLGKDFPWVKPSGCPRCGQALWWHGFVLAYFSCLLEPVLLRRLRCSCCRSVHRLKPAGYWRRFRSTISEITQSVACRSESGRWCRALPRTRQRQWWLRLKRMAGAVLGLFRDSVFEAFGALLDQGFIPVSLCFQRDNSGAGPPPYRSVSLPSISR
ncbi:MAG: hypothetical protein L3J63_06245 [Geopsychrobacter sp.]|nr:hypothetical protein [Geopsychrobacter sp.]